MRLLQKHIYCWSHSRSAPQPSLAPPKDTNHHGCALRTEPNTVLKPQTQSDDRVALATHERWCVSVGFGRRLGPGCAQTTLGTNVVFLLQFAHCICNILYLCLKCAQSKRATVVGCVYYHIEWCARCVLRFTVIWSGGRWMTCLARWWIGWCVVSDYRRPKDKRSCIL